ncbi:6-phosphogluconolactonase [Chitinophaga sp. CF118]|uniref:lactonase family protein n=1 Tax=Chitinophaga sp. CF118 TaxID=1884367 RepID=UPI0008F39C20|nr:lactonase family protein [Chitinophaga sp. CF118]SFE66474.1 6-phosphogluconolactonase [Chitinophaga sp. CF118]
MLNTLLTYTSLLLSSVPQTKIDTTTNESFLLVGTYTKNAEQGINVYAFNNLTGTLRFVSIVKDVDNPEYLVIAPDKKHVYATNEGKTPTVSAFDWDTTTGQLNFLNKQPSGGDSPCYVNIDQDGKYVIVGNYGGGSLSVLPVKEDGRIDAPVQTIEHTGAGVNKARQEKPHVHCVVFSPDHQFLYAADLGIDQVAIYAYKQGDVQPLTPASPGSASFPPGSGPRHLIFHPNGKWVYVIHELDGKITAFNYKNGALIPFQMISTLPEQFKGQISAADIHTSPDGKFLYASNRGSLNNIVIYSIDQKKGLLVKKGQQPSGGKTPRNFMIVPSGNFLLAANQDSDNIAVFKRDKITGLLRPVKQETKVPAPVCLKMIGSN